MPTDIAQSSLDPEIEWAKPSSGSDVAATEISRLITKLAIEPYKLDARSGTRLVIVSNLPRLIP